MKQYREIIDALMVTFGLLERSSWRSIIDSFATRRAPHKSQRDKALASILADSTQIRALAEELLVDESHFLRNKEQLDVVVDFVNARLRNASANARVTLYSLGCAHGEEPYSLAMLLSQAHPDAAMDRVSILGCDMRQKCIEKAQGGVFSAWAFRGVPPSLVSKHFLEDSATQTFRLNESIVKRVKFTCSTAQDLLAHTLPRSADVILFRNVAIYLDAEERHKIVSAACDALKPDGLFVLAPADPQPTNTSLVALRQAGAGIYSLTPEKPATRELPPLRPAVERRQDDPKKLHAEAQRLADQGQLERALIIASHLVVTNGSALEGLMLRGQILMSCLDPKAAARDFSRATKEAPGDPLPRYWLALALKQNGKTDRALTELDGAASLLERALPNELLSDGKTTVHELLEATRFLKNALE